MFESFKTSALGGRMLEWLIGFKMARRSRHQLTHSQFLELNRRFRGNSKEQSRYFSEHFRCRVAIDPPFTRIVKKFKADFNLVNFVETGTYDGETTLAMSLIFERVFTCDVKDWPRSPELYFADNVTYETKTSPDFLRDHLSEIRRNSLFFLDAHWGANWPLLDELALIFRECEQPVIIIDDFDAGNGLGFDQYGETKLDADYIARHIPDGYKFFVNPASHRNRGMIFLFPSSAHYGCSYADRVRYSEEQHGMWHKVKP